MSISNLLAEIRQFKNWFGYGGQLLWLRLRMMRLDVVEQIRSIILLIAAVLGICILFFLGIISLLFALNSFLSVQAKIWTFSGIAFLFLLLLLILLVFVVKLWRRQGSFMHDTLDAMHEDFQYLNHHTVERRHHD